MCVYIYVCVYIYIYIFERLPGTFDIAPRNRHDTLDPALLRPGRLDRKIEFPLPDRRGQALMAWQLEVHGNNMGKS